MLSTDPIDLLLDANGDLVIPVQFVSGLQAVIQRVKIRLQMFRGEWFLNQELGVPYYQEVLGHKFDKAKTLSIFRQPIITTPGVIELISISVTFDPHTRLMSISFRAITGFGDTGTQTVEIQ